MIGFLNRNAQVHSSLQTDRSLTLSSDITNSRLSQSRIASAISVSHSRLALMSRLSSHEGMWGGPSSKAS